VHDIKLLAKTINSKQRYLHHLATSSESKTSDQNLDLCNPFGFWLSMEMDSTANY